MKGFGLARIIQDNINWNRRKNTGKKIDVIIRDTMQEIEEYARFRFLKYSSCYLDILRFHLSSSGKSVKDEMPPLNLWLEFGASKQTQISLMGLGFSRSAAIELAELIVIDDYDTDKCLEWLLMSNVEALGLSPIIVEEIKTILAYHGQHT